MVIGTYISIITLNVNRLDAPTKRHRLAEWIILSKVIYRYNATPIKLPMAYFADLEQKNLKICMETQKIPYSQSNLEKEKHRWRDQAP